jgi:hypothetical protein
MTDRELLLNFIALIEPIHKFNLQVQRYSAFFGESHYSMPTEYVRKFSKLYEELVKHIGTPGEADTHGSTTPASLPERTPLALSPGEQPSPLTQQQRAFHPQTPPSDERERVP